MIYVYDGLRHIRAASGIFLCSFTVPTKQHLDEHAMPPPPTSWPSCFLCMSKWLRLGDPGPPHYKDNASKGWGGDPRRGAAVGRTTVLGDPGYAGSLLFRRVRLDSGGYDVNGTYFGAGNPLYWYASNDGTIDGVLRAQSRTEARMRVLAMYPKARVRR